MKFRTQFSKKRKSIGVDCQVEPSMTHPEFRDECDINLVVARYLKTGDSALLKSREAFARYGDFTQVPDFQDMLDKTASAREAFGHLDSKTREAFDNDPQKLISAVSDPLKADMFVHLGLATKREVSPSVEETKAIKAEAKSAAKKLSKSEEIE